MWMVLLSLAAENFASTLKDDWNGRCNNLQIIEDQRMNNEGF
jgi:hypothetical protein